MSDPVIGMQVSDLVGAHATTTATGYMGAQIVAALQNQGVQAEMEGPQGMNAKFNKSSVEEQATPRKVAMPAPAVANNMTIRA